MKAVPSSHHHRKVQSHPAVTFSGYNGLSSITWGFSQSQIRQFCLLTHPPSAKCLSLPKKILFEKLSSTAYDVMNGQLISIVAWAKLYMGVGVYLNAQYAIMYPKTVLIPENDKQLTHSGLQQHFHLHRPFNNCKHSNLLKFLQNLANCLRSWMIM